MATLTHHESATAEHLVLSSETRKKFIWLILAGIVLFIVGVALAFFGVGAEHAVAGHEVAGHGGEAHHGSPLWLKRIIVSIWHSNIFFLGLSIVGTVWVAINTVAYAGWSAAIRRVPEATSAWVLPGGIILIIAFLLNLWHSDIFHWTTPGIMTPGSENYDAIIAGKSGFLSIPFYLIRTVSYLIIWWVFTERLRKLSLEEDLNGGTYYFHQSIKTAALFLVLFAVSESMSAWDWVMSIDTHWYSTMFGWYVFASWWVSGIAAITLCTIFLKQAGYLRFVNASHLHDLGKFMFGFSIFWTYIWFSQFMLIWYANIPEESVYFNQRLGGFDGAYTGLFFFNLLINFAFPFLVMMTRDAKRQMIMLKIVSIAILVGHWFDFYLMIMPATMQGNNGFIIEIGTALIFLGSFLLLLTKRLSQASLVPVNHPFLDESIHHTT